MYIKSSYLCNQHMYSFVEFYCKGSACNIYHNHVETSSLVISEIILPFEVSISTFPFCVMPLNSFKIVIRSISSLAVKICLCDKDCMLFKISGFGRSIINWQLLSLKSFTNMLIP